jgi:predicted RNase H-like nuclease (RuvC/YqgF family)
MKFQVLILLAVASGCSKKTTTVDEKCTKYAEVYVTNVQKSTANTADVSFTVNSGCGQFNKFIQKSEGNTRIIKVEAVYKGCMCTMDIPTRTTTYSFTEKTSGTYYLKFLSGENQYITDTVIIK